MKNIPEHTIAVIDTCAKKSQAGEIDFGTVVTQLITVGVESYYADYRRHETVYYFPSGETHTVKLPITSQPIAEHFDAEGVRLAIRGAQSGSVKYPEFKKLTMDAGCIGYFVWIAGACVQYFGRKGESHIEYFPK